MIRNEMFKQFVVKNCKLGATRLNNNRNSNENETNETKWNFDTNRYIKRIAYYADYKYTSFIKFSFTRQRLRAREHLPDFQKKRKTPPKINTILMKITLSDSVYQRTLLYRYQAPTRKIVESLPEERSRMRV